MLAGLFGTTPTATTLAILRSSNELVIAADSLMTLYDGRPQQACKIRMHGDVVFATAGLVVSSEGVLDTHRVITDVLRRPVTWTEHVQTIEDRLQEPLLRTLRRLRRERPDEFRRRIQQGFVLHVTLAAFRYGRTVLEMREFFVETNGPDELRIRVKRVSCPGQCLREIEVFGVGETEAMMRELREIRRFPPDLAAFGRDLVMRQVRATPVFVGPPVARPRLWPVSCGPMATVRPARGSPVECSTDDPEMMARWAAGHMRLPWRLREFESVERQHV